MAYRGMGMSSCALLALLCAVSIVGGVWRRYCAVCESELVALCEERKQALAGPYLSSC